MEFSLVPSLPAQSFEELSSLADALDDVATELQIDIVDGVFVPATSWPFTEQNPRAALERIGGFVDRYQIEIDCMIMHPEQYLDLFALLKIPRVIVHMGSTELYTDIIEHAHVHGYKLGFAFTNDIPIETVDPFISSIDFVQIMGIKHVGKQGQPFDERTLETARRLRTAYPELEIAVDGSVNKDTILPLKEAGVNRFAPGSAVAKQNDPKAAYTELLALLR